MKAKSSFVKTGVTNFSLKNKKKSWNFSIPLIGEMNIYNGAAAIISCLELGFSAQVIQEKILSFKNAKRRLELKTNQPHVLVFDKSKSNQFGMYYFDYFGYIFNRLY